MLSGSERGSMENAIYQWCEEYVRASERPDYAAIVRRISEGTV